MWFTDDDVYQNFLVFTSTLSCLILDSNKKFTNSILNRISSQKNRPFYINLECTMSNLAYGRATFKLNHSVLVQKSTSSLYSNFSVYLYVVYELNNWPRNPSNNFPLEVVYCYSQISKKCNQK